MAMVQSTARWTADMLRRLPDDGNRYEIIRGELFVTPSPAWRHQDAVLRLAVLLDPYVRANHLGRVIVAPADVEFAHDTVVIPDLFVVPDVDGTRPARWGDVGRMWLAVEVLSPSSSRADRVRKRALYQEEKVPEYWIIDVDARLVERWRAGADRPELVVDALVWQPDAGHAALTIDLVEYFASFCGEG
jgi:Uma2 family endonuclease